MMSGNTSLRRAEEESTEPQGARGESASAEKVKAGQAVYSPRVLSIYDLWVLGVSNHWIWRCPTPRILALYDAHISSRHLDIGVGTGYFLDRCRFPTSTPKIALLDLNPNSLEQAAQRIARYKPALHKRNALKPFALDESFDSVSMSYLLHCLPGTMAEKSIVFDHAAAVMKPGAVLFGASLLGEGLERSRAARALMAIYNRKGIFSNTADSMVALETALQRRFSNVKIEVCGAAALFSAYKPHE